MQLNVSTGQYSAESADAVPANARFDYPETSVCRQHALGIGTHARGNESMGQVFRKIHLLDYTYFHVAQFDKRRIRFNTFGILDLESDKWPVASDVVINQPQAYRQCDDGHDPDRRYARLAPARGVQRIDSAFVGHVAVSELVE